MRFTEEDAGYVTVRPVVKQTFRLAELTDMVVRVTGKNASRVQQIFRAGTVVYNGYRYWWDGFASKEDEVTGLLALFPDDDPARVFNPAEVTAVSLEIGGGTQRSLVGIARREASAKKLFQKRNHSTLREVLPCRTRRCLSRPPPFRDGCLALETSTERIAARPAQKIISAAASCRPSILHPSCDLCWSGNSVIGR